MDALKFSFYGDLMATSFFSKFGVQDDPVGDQGVGDQFLRELDLSQSQVAALLGVTPQAISKGLKEDGVSFFAKEQKAQRLYAALLFVGGDRFSLSASRLKDAARQLNWGNLEVVSGEQIAPVDLYEDADELWVVSDFPGKIIDWELMAKNLFSEPTGDSGAIFGDKHKVIVFFFSTIEGAESWAEVFEREMLKLAIRDYKVQAEKALHTNAYVFFVVTNLAAYSQDFLIANPGSQCMGVSASRKPPKVFYWNSGSYVRAEYSAREFVKTVRHFEIGTTAIKANFFPSGLKLQKEILDLGKPCFMDGLIAIRGRTEAEDTSIGGDDMAGGIFRSMTGRPENVHLFNKRTKFCPLFLLAYKRKPGDSFHKSNRTVSIIQDELANRQKEDKSSTENQAASKPTSFW